MTLSFTSSCVVTALSGSATTPLLGLPCDATIQWPLGEMDTGGAPGGIPAARKRACGRSGGALRILAHVEGASATASTDAIPSAPHTARSRVLRPAAIGTGTPIW